MTGYKIHFVEVIQRIREKFGDDKIYLMITLADKVGKVYGRATFDESNLEEFLPWGMVIEAKLFSEEVIQIVPIILRVTIPDRYEVTKNGKKVKIAGTDMYHFVWMEGKCYGQTEEETFKTQNTDAKNQENFLAPEPYMDYRSAEELLEEFVK